MTPLRFLAWIIGGLVASGLAGWLIGNFIWAGHGQHKDQTKPR